MKKNLTAVYYTVGSAQLIREAEQIERDAADMLKSWIITRQTDRYSEEMAKARILRAAAAEKNVSIRREMLRNSGFSVLTPKQASDAYSPKRKKNPIRDDHVIAIESDAGGGWIESVNYPHENPRGRRKNPARRYTGVIRVANGDGTYRTETVDILYRFSLLIGGRYSSDPLSKRDFFVRMLPSGMVQITDAGTGFAIGAPYPPDTVGAVGATDKAGAKRRVENAVRKAGAEKYWRAVEKAGPI
jgi:hypothetical protein